MRLTEQQVNYFKTFGFLIFRQLFSASEVKRYRQEFDSGLDAWIGGSHDGMKRVWAPLMDSNTPFIASLLDDPRFVSVGEQLLGKEMMGIVTDANYYVGDTQWHPDMGTAKQRAAKFTIYLDPLDASNGALRVIPGSHLEPLHSELRSQLFRTDPQTGQSVRKDPQEAFGVRPDQIPAFAFESNPGDALVFNNAIWHAAFGGSEHRRMGTVIYYEDPQTPEAVAIIQKVMRGNHENCQKTWNSQFYPEYWRKVGNPLHQQWVRRLDELGILETPIPAG